MYVLCVNVHHIQGQIRNLQSPIQNENERLIVLKKEEEEEEK